MKKIDWIKPKKFAQLFSRRAGFTLIEMLVVVAVIGLLSSAVLVGLNDARERARDSRRVADLRQIQNGLEIFYSNNRFYPRDAYDDVKQQLPKDPQGGEYKYIRKSPQSYIVGACLENQRPVGVEGIDTNDQVGPVDSPLEPSPNCRCGDPNGYCVGIGIDGGN